jgi:hypothetical protein
VISEIALSATGLNIFPERLKAGEVKIKHGFYRRLCLKEGENK